MRFDRVGSDPRVENVLGFISGMLRPETAWRSRCRELCTAGSFLIAGCARNCARRGPESGLTGPMSANLTNENPSAR